MPTQKKCQRQNGVIVEIARIVTGDGGVWLRRQVLAMAQVNCTPAPYWLEMPLYQFRQWIRSSNELIAERQRARKDGK